MPGVSCTYVRIFINGATRGGGVAAIAEFQILDTNNVNLTTGGTATASSGTASNAFDGVQSSQWVSGAAPSSGSPQWLQYQFGSAQNVVAVMVENEQTSNNPAVSSPVTFLIQTSPDGTTWTTQNTITSYPSWFTGNQKVYFAASSVVGDARVSQVAVEAVKTGNTFRVSQLALEAVQNRSANVKISQIAAELVQNRSAHVAVSQLAVELVQNRMSHISASQIALEVIYPFEYVAPQPIIQCLL